MMSPKSKVRKRKTAAKTIEKSDREEEPQHLRPFFAKDSSLKEDEKGVVDSSDEDHEIRKKTGGGGEEESIVYINASSKQIEINRKERMKRGKYNIAMVSDFMFPRVGGVENHQFFLGQCLIERGHKVILITGTYSGTVKEKRSKKRTGNVLISEEEKEEGGKDMEEEEVDVPYKRQGVRYLTNGMKLLLKKEKVLKDVNKKYKIKIYYLPLMEVVDQVCMPIYFPTMIPLRNIFVREQIDIVHAHQSTSNMGQEAILHAGMLGIKTVFTDHSLFSFGNLASIHLNKVISFTLKHVDHAICVSHTSKENLVLRTRLARDRVSVIPNAIDSSKFTHTPSTAPPIEEKIVIVMVSRLVYRKGIDLAVNVIPKICKMYPKVHFLIGGGGPKRLDLDEMCERYSLQERVTFVGPILNEQVPALLRQGHLFLNCSLTEAFCIAIVEAISCGLLCVSTRVGGVEEVIPESMIFLAEPHPHDILEKIKLAVKRVMSKRDVHPEILHEKIAKMYNWRNVAKRTERVYDTVVTLPKKSISERLEGIMELGPYIGILLCLLITVGYIVLQCMEWINPRESIDICPDICEAYRARKEEKRN